MKKFCFLFFSLFFIALYGCGEEANYFENCKVNYELFVGDEVTFDFSILNVSFTADNDVVKIDGTKVTCEKAGASKLTAKYQDQTFTITVVVKEKVSNKLICEQKVYQAKVDDVIEITAYTESNSSGITYSSSSSAISIKDNKVTCLEKGTAIVKVKFEEQEMEVTIEIDDKIVLFVEKELYELFIGEEIELLAYLSTGEGVITYSSLSNSIKLDNNKITGLKVGEAVIKVKFENQEKEIKILVKEKPLLILDIKEYDVDENDTVEIKAKLSTGEGTITYTTDSSLIKLENNIVTGLKIGKGTVLVKYEEQEIIVNINVLPKVIMETSTMEIYQFEEKKPDVTITKGDPTKLVLTALDDGIEIKNNMICGLLIGESKIKVELDGYEKIMLVNVIKNTLQVKNEFLEVDYLENLPLQIEFPSHLKSELEYYIAKAGIIEIKDKVVYPITAGKTRVRVSLVDYPDVKQTIEITVVVDPIKIIKAVHIENIIMKKAITTFGYPNETRPVYGCVSRYLFDKLNIIQQIPSIYANKYQGMTATPEIIAELDGKGCPRTGIKLEEIKYLIYHDTGNAKSGADAKMHANYMVSSDSVNNRARSWHYTVDCNTIYQQIPDDEVSWQGDSYDAYAKSIGIETCVNANLNMVWQRMGKLCASLILRYGLSIDSIKQHYDMSGKNCPQTLRMSGLYPYAISLVEGELLVSRALSNYTITFKSLNPEYVNDKGSVIKSPDLPIQVGYTVTITNSLGYNESVTLYSNLNPAE